MSRIRDVSMSRRYQKELSDLAYKDTLTGLPNRLSAENWVDSVVSSPECLPLLLIGNDLDGFQNINELFGHHIGDEVLKAFSQWVQAQPQLSGWTSRLASDCFLVGIKAPDSESVLRELPELLRKLDLSPFLSGIAHEQILITASSGVVVAHDSSLGSETLLEQVNTALVKAAATGRSGFVVYDDQLRLEIQETQFLEQALHQSIAHGGSEFSLVYQPQVDCQGRLCGAESLLRWQLPNGHNVSPSDFIPLAERTGQIHSIGDWVIKRSLSQMSEWRDQGFSLPRLAINVSASLFKIGLNRLSLADSFAYYTQAFGIDSRMIEVEI